MPLISKVIAVVAVIAIAGIIVTAFLDYRYRREVEAELAALPGKCIDLTPVNKAQIKGVVRQGRGKMVEVVQTDAVGNESVAFVPLQLAQERLKPCN